MCYLRVCIVRRQTENAMEATIPDNCKHVVILKLDIKHTRFDYVLGMAATTTNQIRQLATTRAWKHGCYNNNTIIARLDVDQSNPHTPTKVFQKELSNFDN